MARATTVLPDFVAVLNAVRAGRVGAAAYDAALACAVASGEAQLAGDAGRALRTAAVNASLGAVLGLVTAARWATAAILACAGSAL